MYAEGVTAPLITNLAYGETSDYLNLSAGDYNVQLRAAGSPAGSTPAFETGTLTIPDGAKITALAVGLLFSGDPADQFRVLPLDIPWWMPVLRNFRRSDHAPFWNAGIPAA